jgi:hypothetical protein
LPRFQKILKSAFFAGGVVLQGHHSAGLYVSDAPWTGKLPIPIDKMSVVELKPSQFLSQKRIFFRGHVFRTEQIIKHMSNKGGGVHFDITRKNPTETVLDQAADYFDMSDPARAGDEHLVEHEGNVDRKFQFVLPSDNQYRWTCLHVEMLAAAQSFMNMRVNGSPLAIFDTATERQKRRNDSKIVHAGDGILHQRRWYDRFFDRVKVFWYSRVLKKWQSPERH